MSLAGLAAAAYATSAVLRLRAEETGGQAEPLLATATSRIRWGLSHVVVAVAGTAALLAVAGVAAGLGYGLRTGSAGSEVARLLGAAMVQLPASLAVAGAVVVLIALFGQVLQLSPWVLDVSPFTHVPKLPGAAVTVLTTGAPLFWLGLAALALAAAGLAGLRRRDIG
jgi:ABC-2 type transport system permease protein